MLRLNSDKQWNIYSVNVQMSNDKQTKQLFLSNDLSLVYF